MNVNWDQWDELPELEEADDLWTHYIGHHQLVDRVRIYDEDGDGGYGSSADIPLSLLKFHKRVPLYGPDYLSRASLRAICTRWENLWNGLPADLIHYIEQNFMLKQVGTYCEDCGVGVECFPSDYGYNPNFRAAGAA